MNPLETCPICGKTFDPEKESPVCIPPSVGHEPLAPEPLSSNDEWAFKKAKPQMDRLYNEQKTDEIREKWLGHQIKVIGDYAESLVEQLLAKEKQERSKQ